MEIQALNTKQLKGLPEPDGLREPPRNKLAFVGSWASWTLKVRFPAGNRTALPNKMAICHRIVDGVILEPL